MSPGQVVRRVLGPAFQPVGEAYRRIFVDMDKVADWMLDRVPRNAHVLDVGGGDGYVVNLLLSKRADIRVTMIDVAAQIGGFIAPQHFDRVRIRPNLPMEKVSGAFDVIMLADVIHHVRADDRAAFFSSLGKLALRAGSTSVIIKDFAPGYGRSLLALLADRYITGDRHVRFLEPREVVLPGFRNAEMAMVDPPNYCLVFKPPISCSGSSQRR